MTFRGSDGDWGVQLTGGTRGLPVAARPETDAARYPLPGGREVYAAANPSGDLVLTDRVVRPVVTGMSWDDDTGLVLEGTFPAARYHTDELVLRHSGHQEERSFAVERTGGGFRAALSPGAVDGPGGALPLAEGRWYPFLRKVGETDPERYLPLRVVHQLHAGLPRWRETGGRRFTLERRFHDRLSLRSGSALPPHGAGRVRAAAAP